MRRTLACCLVAALVAGPACMKTAYIVPARAEGVELPEATTVVVGRPTGPKANYQVAIQERCIHWDTAKAVGTDGREVRAEVEVSRHTKLVGGSVLAVIGLPALIGGPVLFFESAAAPTGDGLQGAFVAYAKIIFMAYGILLTAAGAGMEAGGIRMLVSGARDPCTSPPHLPLSPAATATAQ